MTAQRFQPDPRPLPAGLHFIATPIGAARDITLRALDILATADVLVLLVDHKEFKATSGDTVHQQYVVDTKGVWR